MKNETRMNLNTQAWSRSFYFAIILALLLFIPAGTIRYWQAWGYLMLFFGASSGNTIYLMKNDPALLMRRMHAGPRAEKSKTQKIIMLFAITSFAAIFIVSALDYRFKWSPAPLFAVVVGYISVAIGFVMTFFVVKENTFASATIEVSQDQQVISTGLYAVVRHPMYTGGTLIILGTPLSLSSLSGIIVSVISIIWIIWGGNAVPMPVDHRGEFLVRREPLPLQARAPVLEEASCPTLALVAPQLAEALLENIGRVEPLVGRQQCLQRPLAVEREVLLARQQGVFLALDVAPVAALQPRVLALADRIQSLAEMAHDMEFVEQNRGLRRMRLRRQAERLPHVHDGKANARTLALAEPGVELPHARLRAVLAAEPDRSAAQKVADHDPVSVALADRYLIDPDHLRTGCARARELGLHVLHFQRLDRVPVERQFLCHVRNRRLPAAPPDKIGEALGVERIVRQKVEPLPFHLAAAAAIDAPHL